MRNKLSINKSFTARPIHLAHSFNQSNYRITWYRNAKILINANSHTTLPTTNIMAFLTSTASFIPLFSHRPAESAAFYQLINPSMKSLLIKLSLALAFVAFVKYTLFSHANTCSQLEAETKNRLKEFAQCSQDSDCTFVRLNCPFDCLTGVNRNQVDALLSSISTYNKSCMMVCPSCPKTEPQVLACENGLCSAKISNILATE